MSTTERLPPAIASVGPRLLFFGMAGRFSAVPLAALLRAGLPLAGVVMPGLPGGPPIVERPPTAMLRSPLPLLGQPAAPTIADLAWQADVPVYTVSRLADPTTLAVLADRRPDLLCVACFPRRLPPALLTLAPLGGLNLHPSLLPAGRGPTPRFWAFRHGLHTTGVTVHQMTDALDAGPIVAQATFDLPDGLTGADFDERAATLGADLLIDAARAVAAGAARPVPQEPTHARYDPAPTDPDYLVTADRPARWAYNFMRGVAGDGGPLAVVVDGRPWPVAHALAYAPDGGLGAAVRWAGDSLWLPCTPGWLHVRLAPSSGRPAGA